MRSVVYDWLSVPLRIASSWGRNWKKDSFGVVIIVPYDSKTKSFTLVKEYSVAHDRFVYGFPTGMIDLDKHSSPLDAAEQELDEEAHLTCNKLINLLAPMAEHGVPQVTVKEREP